MARICGKIRGESRIFKQKGLELTTLAIVGAGIAGRSLTYALAKVPNSFSKILIFDSDLFAPTCAFRSTAIVAPRGLSSGHSDLGDLLMAAFQSFSQHVADDLPLGVFPITQYTGAISKLEQFRQRYPDGDLVLQTPHFLLRETTYLATENAFMVDPELYLAWLKSHSSSLIEWKEDFILEHVNENGLHRLRTQSGSWYEADQVVYAGGNYNRYWRPQASLGVQKSQPVQGAYLEFPDVPFGTESFSLTVEGDNLVYHAHSQKLLIGSTTDASHLLIGVEKELQEIYQRLEEKVELSLPPFSHGKMIVGLREKAAKRRPYLESNEYGWWLGGFYKNGYSLGIHLGMELAHKLSKT